MNKRAGQSTAYGDGSAAWRAFRNGDGTGFAYDIGHGTEPEFQGQILQQFYEDPDLELKGDLPYDR